MRAHQRHKPEITIPRRNTNVRPYVHPCPYLLIFEKPYMTCDSATRQQVTSQSERQRPCPELFNSMTQISVEEETIKAHRFLLEHESAGKLAWDIFMVVLIIFSAFINPLQIGETKDRLDLENGHIASEFNTIRSHQKRNLR